ncbi:MAG: hypothetical protein AABY07_01035 [Nanoarchaeota archaeon]
MKRVYIVEHSPYDFFGETRYQYFKIEASSCVEAVWKFRKDSKENFEARVMGVRPFYAIRWRTDKTLTDLNCVLKYALAKGWLPKPTESGRFDVSEPNLANNG